MKMIPVHIIIRAEYIITVLASLITISVNVLSVYTKIKMVQDFIESIDVNIRTTIILKR